MCTNVLAVLFSIVQNMEATKIFFESHDLTHTSLSSPIILLSFSISVIAFQFPSMTFFCPCLSAPMHTPSLPHYTTFHYHFVQNFDIFPEFPDLGICLLLVYGHCHIITYVPFYSTKLFGGGGNQDCAFFVVLLHGRCFIFVEQIE